MPFSSTALVVQSKACQDRHLSRHTEGGLVLAVADGAGGISGGAWAAEFAIRKVEIAARGPASTIDPVVLVADIDAQMLAVGTGGQTTLVVAIVADDGSIRGASVGDSEAWIVGPSEVVVLTRSQNRKPLLGEMMAVPVAFSAEPLGTRTLLLATDGMTKYVPFAKLAEACRIPDLVEAQCALRRLVKPGPGEPLDDAVAVLCRTDPAQRPRS